MSSDQIQKTVTSDSQFSYNQSVLRSRIRLKEGRPKPIDIIVYSISLLDEQKMTLTSESTPKFMLKDVSYKILDSLNATELREMTTDIEFHSIYCDSRSDFWQSFKFLCLQKEKQLRGDEFESVIQSEILEEIHRDLQAKSSMSLQTFGEEIQLNMTARIEGLDVEFWDQVLRDLQIYKARALLNEYHLKIMSQYDLIKDEKIEQKIRQHLEDTDVIREMRHRAKENDAVGDYDFHDEFSLPSKGKDLRKPHYYIKTVYGIDFSKYQEDKYSKAPPPRKYVQGYKFHIFYPDLQGQVPDFVLDIQDPLSETCVIIFRGVAPYDDIAFTIVNKEWDRNHRYGYRATFERGMLVLHFAFRKPKMLL